MPTTLRMLIGAAVLAFATACDSFPGAMDPEPEGPAQLIVRNAGSRRITSVELRACGSGQLVKWTRTDIGPSQSWSRGYPAGCHNVEVEFNSGGGWTTPVTLSESQPQTISPW